jgi:hypothetical protein
MKYEGGQFGLRSLAQIKNSGMMDQGHKRNISSENLPKILPNQNVKYRNHTSVTPVLQANPMLPKAATSVGQSPQAVLINEKLSMLKQQLKHNMTSHSFTPDL